MTEPYDHKKIESKWRQWWAEQGTYKSVPDKKKGKCYVLNEFPYPSGEGLHVGHPKGYIAGDIYARYKRMRGFSVLHPFGWDAFGLPAENYALKHKIQPRLAVAKNIARFKEQIGLIGLDYDWSREINTSDPLYYKWTQWIFLQMWRRGLAYESNEPINWCPSCQTGLANEDLEKGRCERCGNVVEKRPIRQWLLRITKYADRLLKDLDKLPEWPEEIKAQQRAWIGRSEGLLFKAKVKDMDLELETFSAHFEACFADTFVLVAPDHPVLDALLKDVAEAKHIRNKIAKINQRRLEEGYAHGEIEGVFTGRYLDDPLGNGHLPIWVANFVMSDYGTGIVRCSAHDPRDFAFAKKYALPLRVAIVPIEEARRPAVLNFEVCFNDFEHGVLLSPKKLAGTSGLALRELVAEYVVTNHWARPVTMYRLRDWVFSRQRYWGEPIPLIHCRGCGVVAVPEKDLPVPLPEIKHYEPTGTGESPLANIPEWVNVKCPGCAGPGRRETNTMPQWAGSSWYYLAFTKQGISNFQFSISKKDSEREHWMPIDLYIGGSEHVTRHLIYARFWHKFLFDIGVIGALEPFTRRVGTGLILGADGRKMSKRWNNVVNPDEVIERVGADAFRLYEMFLGPFSETANWNDRAIAGPRRFLEKIWKLAGKVSPPIPPYDKGRPGVDISARLNQAIRKINNDIENFKFNTAVSELMKLGNDLENSAEIDSRKLEIFLKLLAPFAPHLTEELWHKLGHNDSIHLAAWPEVATSSSGESVASQTIVALPIQIDGKIRDSVFVESEAAEQTVRGTVLGSAKVQKWLAGREIKKFVYVPGRIVSISSA